MRDSSKLVISAGIASTTGGLAIALLASDYHRTGILCCIAAIVSFIMEAHYIIRLFTVTGDPK
jgi:hypothetical protein